MINTTARVDGGALAGWLSGRHPVRPGRSRRPVAGSGGLRFAFYGRMSTEDFQDEESSRHWQLTAAKDLIAGRGVIVAEYFDVGCSRRRLWQSRPRAASLLSAVADPGRGFDAIVVGEFERAFHGQQLEQLMPLLAAHGVALWLPETHGPVDGDDATQRALMMLLGAQSKREVLRARFRTTAAMRGSGG